MSRPLGLPPEFLPFPEGDVRVYMDVKRIAVVNLFVALGFLFAPGRANAG